MAEFRPPGRGDAATVAELLNERSRALHGTDAVTEAEVLHWLGIPTLDPERDFLVAVGEDDRLLAYADLNDGGPSRTRYWMTLELAPGAADDIGRELVASLERRARETAASDALVRGFVAGADERGRALFESAGYRLIRHSLRMEIELSADEPSAPAWPEGIAPRSFADDDSERVYEAANDAFADHWEFEREPYEDWLHWMKHPNRDPALWFLAADGDDIAGIALCSPHESGVPDVGWVDVLGVRPASRVRGLGLALLRHSFRELHRRGLRRVALGVDAENTTGAVRLYERAGMRIARRYDIFDRPLG